jgi:hypothetical protein
MISKDGHVKMSYAVPWDNRQLYRILLVFVDAEKGLMPLYFDHLLEMLHGTSELYRCDPNFITFLINHPSLLTYVERNQLFCLLDQMIRKLRSHQQMKVLNMIILILGIHSRWHKSCDLEYICLFF